MAVSSIDSLQFTTGPNGVNNNLLLTYDTSNNVDVPVNDENVEFLQNGSSVYRTVQDKLYECVSIEDFGGVSGTDSTAALQNAINAANSVLIPDGTFLISSTVTLNSNSRIFGTGTLQAYANNDIQVLSTGTGGVENIRISGIAIDGGGQVGDIYTGLQNVWGIYITNAANVIVDSVYIKNCGIINKSDPQDDAAYSGYGIIATCNYGAVTTLKILNCIIENIAGGGYYNGDGICIASNNYSSMNITTDDILIDGCSINNIGRNGVSLAGGDSNGAMPPVIGSYAKDIRVTNCKISNTQLAGIDVENGDDMIIVSNEFKFCGNNTYYYNSQSAFGVDYTLCAAITTGVYSTNIAIISSNVENCYYGITFGVGLIKIDNAYISNSAKSDIFRTTEANSGRLIVTNSQFCTGSIELLDYYNENRVDLIFLNCTFQSIIKIRLVLGAVFENCIFENGIIFLFPGSCNVIWDSCTFRNHITSIDISTNVNTLIFDCTVINCCFYSVNIAMLFAYETILRWTINNNIFKDISNYAIRHLNAGGGQPFTQISGNQFISCDYGIYITQASNEVQITNNYFETNSNKCIYFENIINAIDLIDINVSQNICTNSSVGIEISLSTGNYNYCIISFNNFRNCTTPMSIPTGGPYNPNGIVANNII